MLVLVFVKIQALKNLFRLMLILFFAVSLKKELPIQKFGLVEIAEIIINSIYPRSIVLFAIMIYAKIV